MPPQYVSCPRCATPDPKKVGFTWWGGILGPSILSHVKCQRCGLTFNGKTGQSNTGGIVVYTIIVSVIVLALCIAIWQMN